MSELSETSSNASCSSDSFNLCDDSIIPIDANEMKLEELRLKRKRTKEEQVLLRKLTEEVITKEKKDKAIKSMNYLLNNSQRYSRFFLDKFKDYVEDEK